MACISLDARPLFLPHTPHCSCSGLPATVPEHAMTCMSLQRPPLSFLLPPHPVRTSSPLGNLRRLPLTLSWSFSAFREHSAPHYYTAAHHLFSSFSNGLCSLHPCPSSLHSLWCFQWPKEYGTISTQQLFVKLSSQNTMPRFPKDDNPKYKTTLPQLHPPICKNAKMHWSLKPRPN